MRRRGPRFDFAPRMCTLGFHYPGMRFGQLVAFACSLAHQAKAANALVADDRSVVAAVEAERRRLNPEGRGMEIGPAIRIVLSEARGEILDGLEELGEVYPSMSSGEIAMRVAASAGTSIVEVDDDHLVSLIREVMRDPSRLTRAG